MQRLLGPKPRPEGEGGRSPEPPRWGRQQPGRGTVSGTDVELSGGPEGGRWDAPAPPWSPPAARRRPPRTPREGRTCPGHKLSGLEGPACANGGSRSHCPCSRVPPSARPAGVHARHGLATALRACSVCRHGHMDAQRPARLLPECPSQPCPSQGHLGVCTWPPPPPLACAPEPHSCHTSRPVIPGGLAVLSLIPHSFEANPSRTGSSKHSHVCHGATHHGKGGGRAAGRDAGAGVTWPVTSPCAWESQCRGWPCFQAATVGRGPGPYPTLTAPRCETDANPPPLPGPVTRANKGPVWPGGRW